MKKLLPAILIITIICSFLSGCGYGKRIDKLEKQITVLQKALDEAVSAALPMPSPDQTETPVKITAPVDSPLPTPAHTFDPVHMADNFIIPEELETLVKGTKGGYDFTIPYDGDKWFQVDNKNIFVMKFEHIAPEFPWTVTNSNNVAVTLTLRESDYDYLVLKFLRPNIETTVIFEAINSDGAIGGALIDAPNGIHFAVAKGE